MSFEENPSSSSANDFEMTPDFSGASPVRRFVGSADAFALAGGRSSQFAEWTPRGDVLVRLFDIVFALSMGLIVAPFVLLLIVVLKIDTPGPAFFVQQRVGRYGKFFPCIKLRTMVVDAPARLEALLASSPEARAEWERDHKLRDDPRTTPIGRFARKFSLDELPQVINILLGHMSVVGPRPIVEAEVWRYGTFFADYCSVRPGLTGLWQVSGRNHTTYEKRVRLDSFYARNKSLAFDLKIMARSIPVVIGARGAY